VRKAVRVVVLCFLTVLSTAVLGVITALVSAVSLAATALIVPGTGTPDADAVTNYMQNAQSRYIAPFSNCNSADCELDGIDYPASFFPLVIFRGWCEPGRCETWNTSVGTGVDHLYASLQTMNDSEGFVVFGYSQGGAVVSDTLRKIAAEDPSLFQKISSVVMIGNAYNPDGGIFTRLGFLPTIPFLDITFGPPTPVDTGVPMTSIGFEYDPVMYAPLYWGNPLAMLNALAAFDNVHGYYLTPNGKGPTDPIAYGYNDEELAAILATGCPGQYCRLGSEGNKYYMIPAKSLPIMNLITSLVPESSRPLVQPIVELVSPALRVLIDLGYDWTGDPDQTKYLSILPFNPFTNWPQVGVDLVGAVVEGVQNAIGGGATMIAPSGENVSAFAASAPETQKSTGGGVTESGPSPTLTLVQGEDNHDTEVADQNGGSTTGDAATGDNLTPGDGSEADQQSGTNTVTTGGTSVSVGGNSKVTSGGNAVTTDGTMGTTGDTTGTTRGTTATTGSNSATSGDNAATTGGTTATGGTGTVTAGTDTDAGTAAADDSADGGQAAA
jgi:PE-PPE domain